MTLPRFEAGREFAPVSVVIPTHERPNLLYRAVKSVLRQTILPKEIIVVMDGEDPHTRAAVEGLPLVRVICIDPPRGAADARNKGIREATQDWVALLDDDDEWFEDKLARQLTLAQSANSERVIVSGYVVSRSTDGDAIIPRRAPRSGEHIADYLFARKDLVHGEGALLTSTILVPRDLFLECPFRSGLPRHQDSDWAIRASNHGAAVLLLDLPPVIILHSGDDRARISNVLEGGWEQSLIWVRSMRNDLTPTAYAAFLLTVVGHEAARMRAWRTFVPILREALKSRRPGSIHDLMRIGIYLTHWLVPRSLRQRLRRHFPIPLTAPSVMPEQLTITEVLR